MDSNRGRSKQVDERDNLADLIAQIRMEDLREYGELGHIHTSAAFVNRRFLVVKTKGRRGQYPITPELLGTIRVTGFECTDVRGSSLMLLEDKTSRTLRVGHVPVRLFRFPIFVSVPVYQGIKWEARELENGHYARQLVFGICFKQQSAVRFYNRDNVSILTPNQYEEHFGKVPMF